MFLSLPNFPGPVVSPTPPIYKAGAADSKIGLFATADIDTGDIIVCERPIPVFPRLMKVIGPTIIPPAKMMETALAKMPKVDRKAFLALPNYRGSDISVPVSILDSHGLYIGLLLGYDGEFVGVCARS